MSRYIYIFICDYKTINNQIKATKLQVTFGTSDYTITYLLLWPVPFGVRGGADSVLWPF